MTLFLQITRASMIITGIKALGLGNCPLSPFRKHTQGKRNQFMSCLFGTPNVISHLKMCFTHLNIAAGVSKLLWTSIHPQRMTLTTSIRGYGRRGRGVNRIWPWCWGWSSLSDGSGGGMLTLSLKSALLDSPWYPHNRGA